MRYIIKTTVSHVEQRFAKHWVSGIGSNAQFNDEDLGWFVGFDGSHELLHLGMTHPGLKLGDKIKITIEKEVPDAITGQTPIE